MSENQSLVYGRVKHFIPPPNMLFLTQTGDVECFDYNGSTMVLETIRHVPATQAFKHCPTVPFTASNYAVGLPAKVIDKEDDIRISRLIQQQEISAQVLNIKKNGVKVQAALSTRPSRTTIEVDKVSQSISVQLPLPHTARYTFKPLGIMLLDMGEEIQAMLEPAGAFNCDNIFNKLYVEQHSEYCGVTPKVKHNKRKQPASKAPDSAVSTEKVPKVKVDAQKSEVVVKDKPIKRKNDSDKNGIVKKPRNNHKIDQIIEVAPKPKPPPRKKRSVEEKTPKNKTDLSNKVVEIAMSIKQKSDSIVRNHDAKKFVENIEGTTLVSKPKSTPTTPPKVGGAFRIPKIDSQKANVAAATATTTPAKRKNESDNNRVVKRRDSNHVVAKLDMPSLLPDKPFEFKIPKIPSRRDRAGLGESVLQQNGGPENHLVNFHDEEKAVEVEPEPLVFAAKKSSSSHSQEAAVASIETNSEESMVEEKNDTAAELDECILATPVRSMQPAYDDDDEDVLNILADDDDLFMGLDNFDIKNPTRIRKF